MPELIPQAMTGTLLDLCLESPGARSRSRPSSAPIRHGKRRSKDPPHGPSRKALGHRSPTCGVCGRPSAKTGPELPFEWVNLYQESSNPKHGWKSCKTIRADVGKSKGSPVEAEDVPPKEFILPPTRLPRPKPMPNRGRGGKPSGGLATTSFGRRPKPALQANICGGLCGSCLSGSRAIKS